MAQGDEPLVSVVIPTHDRPRMLQDAVDSVRDQTYDHLELIIVDDASPTPAAETLDVPSDIDVRTIRHADNRGANAARNTGIDAANGAIIAFLDDDDRWEPGKITAQVAAFREADGPVGVVLVGQRYVTEQGKTTAIKTPKVNGPAAAAMLRGVTAGTFSVIAVHRDAIAAAGRPDERFPSLQDREWLIRLGQHCRFRSVPEALVIRRMGDHDQIGDAFTQRRDETFSLFAEKHRETAAAYGLEGPFIASLARVVAASALEAGAYADARRFALRGIRADPTALDMYLLGLLALGGGLTYRPARHVKQHIGRLVNG